LTKGHQLAFADVSGTLKRPNHRNSQPCWVCLQLIYLRILLTAKPILETEVLNHSCLIVRLKFFMDKSNFLKIKTLMDLKNHCAVMGTSGAVI